MLTALPPVLNIQLMRFYFDMRTFDKKKTHDVMTVPYEIDMAAYGTGLDADGVPTVRFAPLFRLLP